MPGSCMCHRSLTGRMCNNQKYFCSPDKQDIRSVGHLYSEELDSMGGIFQVLCRDAEKQPQPNKSFTRVGQWAVRLCITSGLIYYYRDVLSVPARCSLAFTTFIWSAQLQPFQANS